MQTAFFWSLLGRPAVLPFQVVIVSSISIARLTQAAPGLAARGVSCRWSDCDSKMGYLLETAGSWEGSMDVEHKPTRGKGRMSWWHDAMM